MSEIVVGVDGSEGARAALRWAWEEARLRGAALRVVHVWRLPAYAAAPEPTLVGTSGLHPRLDEELQETLAAEAQRVVEGAVAAMEREAGPLDGAVRAESVRGNPAQALVELAAGADLLVVGSRGHGGFVGLLLGSVGQQAVTHAPCPTVVVPAPDAGRGA